MRGLTVAPAALLTAYFCTDVKRQASDRLTPPHFLAPPHTFPPSKLFRASSPRPRSASPRPPQRTAPQATAKAANMGKSNLSNKRAADRAASGSASPAPKVGRIGSFVDLSRGANSDAKLKPHILDNGGAIRPRRTSAPSRSVRCVPIRRTTRNNRLRYKNRLRLYPKCAHEVCLQRLYAVV